MAIVRPEIPQPDTQSEDEIAVSAPTKKFTFHQPISQSGKEAIPDIVKKRKQTSPLKQSDRFIARTDPVRHMKRGMQMLEEAKTHLAKNEASLLEQAISLVQHALAHTQPEPSLEKKFATFAASLNERLGRMEITLASGSPVGSQASLSESTNTDKTNRGNIRSNTSMSYATAASYRESTTSSGNDIVTVPSNRTNDGFTTVQHASRNQPKAASARSFTDQRVILIGSSNTEWQKDVKATRDRLNEALKVKLNTQKPVIASITKTAYSQNTVLVATQHFTAQDLMNNTDIIQPIFAYERI
jgi:DNA polymerase III alpha subunit